MGLFSVIDTLPLLLDIPIDQAVGTLSAELSSHSQEITSMNEPLDGDRNPAPNPAPSAGATGESVLRINDSKAIATYANFCRVNSTPEEVILDLGLNPHPPGTPQVTIDVAQRIVINHYTAKRLLTALTYSLKQHERVFGPLEVDVRKRAARGGSNLPRGKGPTSAPRRPSDTSAEATGE